MLFMRPFFLKLKSIYLEVVFIYQSSNCHPIPDPIFPVLHSVITDELSELWSMANFSINALDSIPYMAYLRIFHQQFSPSLLHHHFLPPLDHSH